MDYGSENLFFFLVKGIYYIGVSYKNSWTLGNFSIATLTFDFFQLTYIHSNFWNSNMLSHHRWDGSDSQFSHPIETCHFHLQVPLNPEKNEQELKPISMY